MEENVQCQGTVHTGLVVCYTLVLLNFLEAQCQGTFPNLLHFGFAVLELELVLEAQSWVPDKINSHLPCTFWKPSVDVMCSDGIPRSFNSVHNL